MREIKFRGLNEKWYFGKLIINTYKGGWINAIQFGNDLDDEDLELYIVNIFNSNSIGQYIGLRDDNDIEIYEGDMVISTYGKCHHEKEGLTRQGIVVYDMKTSSFKISIKDSAVLVGFYDVNKIEVIGNIFEN